MHKKQIIVLDSNEIILGLKGSNSYSKLLIENLNTLRNFWEFRINQQIYEEIIRNLPHQTKEKFDKLLNFAIIKYQNQIVDKKLIDKYKGLGLKKGDIIIAAYADEINSNILISENRHFLKELKSRKFKVINAEKFIKNMME